MVFPPLSHPPRPSFSAYIPRPGIKITITPLSLPSRHSSGSTPALINSTSALHTCTHEAGCGLGKITSNLNGSSFKVIVADLKRALHAGDGLLLYPILLPRSRLFFNAPPWVPSSQPFGFHRLPHSKPSSSLGLKFLHAASSSWKCFWCPIRSSAGGLTLRHVHLAFGDPAPAGSQQLLSVPPWHQPWFQALGYLPATPIPWEEIITNSSREKFNFPPVMIWWKHFISPGLMGRQSWKELIITPRLWWRNWHSEKPSRVCAQLNILT